MGSVNWLFITVFVATVSAQQTNRDQPSELILYGATREVLLDFVVRDKHQREVKDIRAAEVEVFEDGARQTLKSFWYRTANEVPSPSSGVNRDTYESPKLDPLREINLVTMVFAEMSPQSRHQAAASAHDFLRSELGPNTWIGVFALKNALAAIQTYTTDVEILHRAVDRAASGQYQQFAKENLALIQHLNALENDPKYGKYRPLQPGSAEEHVPGLDPIFNPIMAAMDRVSVRLLFQQEGSRAIDRLRALIRQQARFPGRKTVLLFSEGLVIPPDQPELLESLISEANRANVTFYTLDARGLSTVSNNALSEMSYQAMQQQAADEPDAIKTDLQGNARHLAAATGGFAMDNSNDLRAPLRRLMEDVRAHYEVSYSPISAKFDGQFRKLAVRISRPGMTVQSRAGYYALPVIAGESLAPFEMAALRALTTQPDQHAFAFHAAALRFGPAAGGYVYRVVISIPSAALRFAERPADHIVAMHLSALSLIKDEHGQVVRKISKDLSFEVPADRRTGFLRGDTILIMPLDLAPGVYHLETIVIDRVADRASVRRSVVVVPRRRAGCQLSDFVWVRHVQPSADRDVFNPLDTSAGTISPAFDPVFAKSDVGRFYFVVYPASDAADKPVSDMTISRDGKTVVTVRLDLPEPNGDGSYSFLESLQAGAFIPGKYDMQLKTTQSGRTSLLASQFGIQ